MTPLGPAWLHVYQAAWLALIDLVPGPERHLCDEWLAAGMEGLPNAVGLWRERQSPVDPPQRRVLQSQEAATQRQKIREKSISVQAQGRARKPRLVGSDSSFEAFVAACEGSWEGLDPEIRSALGQVFTPSEVVDTILDDVGFDGRKPGKLLDPACGAGAFLAIAAERLLAHGEPARLLEDLSGIEIDEGACGAARLNLGLRVIRHLADSARTGELEALPHPRVFWADALAPNILSTLGTLRWIVGNPPYLEAKRARTEDKLRWRERFKGRVEGAFDQYMCFLELALELAAEDGEIGMIVPNKVLVNRYSRSLRKRLLEIRPPRTMRDLSELPIFRNVGVYPIILHLGPPESSPRGDQACATHGPGGDRLDIPLRTYEATGKAVTFFIPPNPALGRLLSRLLASDMPRLGDKLRLLSTVSFHETGLREQYVSQGLEPGNYKYLGGKSWMRRKEISPFRADWDGFNIRYASEELANKGNPLPPLTHFIQPKIIFCQHARRLMAYHDAEDQYVTKDVYPIALAPENEPDPHTYTAAYAALFNSRVVSVLFAVLFKGISIGGGYYHYLPAFLEQLPTPDIDLLNLARLTTTLQEGDSGDLDSLDDLIDKAYGLSTAEAAAVGQYFAKNCTNADLITIQQAENRCLAAQIQS